MFESLTERLGTALDALTRRGALSKSDVDAALREVRVALLHDAEKLHSHGPRCAHHRYGEVFHRCTSGPSGL